MSYLDVKGLLSQEIDKLDKKSLGDLVLWFNETSLIDIFAVFNNDKVQLQVLERAVSITQIEIKVDERKLAILRSELFQINWSNRELIEEAKNKLKEPKYV